MQQRRKKNFTKSAARCNTVESPTLNAGTKAQSFSFFMLG